MDSINLLQQYLPFTVLKLLCEILLNFIIGSWVATVLTVYGIEIRMYKTSLSYPLLLQQYLPFTVLKSVWRDFSIAK